MGCDIHGRVQVKRWGDKWQDQGEMPDCRNYALFGALADVRCYGERRCIDQPRGLPAGVELDPDDDTNIIVFLEDFWVNDQNPRMVYWIGDHSHSWLTVDEILGWDGWDQEYGPATLRESCNYFLTFCKYLKERWGNDPVRFVFGFDN